MDNPITEDTRHGRLKAIRGALHLMQKDMASELGISASAYSDMEKGRYGLSLDILELLAKKFKVNMMFLVAGSGNMFQSDPTEEVLKIRELCEENSDIEEFIYYFLNSSIIRYHVLSEFQYYLSTRGEGAKNQVKPDGAP